MSTPPLYTICYGHKDIALSWPEDVDVTAVGRRPAAIATKNVLGTALVRPISAPPLSGFLQNAESPLVVVNDATRSTPTASVLKHLLPELNACPNWRVIVATGLHRAPTESERERIFGDTLPDIRDRILIHDGRDSSTHTFTESPAGTISVNSMVLVSDRIILINSVEPHFFAGFTGGRKSLIPGLAGHDTVERSHRSAVTVSAGPLKLEGNPVRQFIEQATQVVRTETVWAIQLVLDEADQIAEAFAGNVDECFGRACDSAREYYTVPVDRHFDIVIAAVHQPLDLNLYQMQKGWELCHQAVREDGVLIVTSPCSEGVGSPFYQRLSEEFPNQADWLALAERPYTMGLHKLVRIARARRRVRLIAVTDMNERDVRRFGYEPFGDVNDAIAEACAHVGTPAHALIVNDAALTTVTIHNDEHS